MKNLMVYAKWKNSKRFGAVNLREGRIDVPLLYATIIPESHKQELITQVRELIKENPKLDFEIRYAGTQRKISLFMVGDRVHVQGLVKYGDEWFEVNTEGIVVDMQSRGMLVTLNRIDGDALATCFVKNKNITIKGELYDDIN
jgi:hypothetical protein